MYVRYCLLCLSIPMMICGGLTASMGPSSIPYAIRNVFMVSWAMDHPEFSFFGAAFAFIVAMLYQSGRESRINNFAS